MANLRIKDQYTNLALDSFGSIQLTTDTPTGNLKIGDSISSIGVKNGLLCVDETLTGVRQGGIRDKFVVPITNNGIITNYQSFINAIKPFNNAKFSPNQITTSLWLDAADASTITEAAGLVSQWDDKSGNSNDATQGTGASQPLTGSRSINGLNGLDFDGIDDYLLNSSANLTSVFNGTNNQFSILAVWQSDDNSLAQRIITATNTATSKNRFEYGPQYNEINDFRTIMINDSSSTNYIDGQGITKDNNAHLSFIGSDGSTFIPRQDGGLFPSEQKIGLPFGLVQNINQVSIGITEFTLKINPFNGIISEILIIDNYVDDSTRQNIEGYLAWKWGLVSNLPVTHPYKSAPPKI